MKHVTRQRLLRLASKPALLNTCVRRAELDRERHVSESGRLLMCQYGAECPWSRCPIVIAILAPHQGRLTCIIKDHVETPCPQTKN